LEGKYYETMQKKELILWEKDVNDGPGFYTEMLSRNRILGILPFTVEETEEKLQYRYDIGTKYALTEGREYTKMSHTQIEKLLRGIVDIIERGREYLIDKKDYVLSPEYIFLATDSDQLYLCCYPLLQKDLIQQLTGVFEYLLSNIDYKDLAAVGMAYELYMKSKQSGSGLSDLLEILERNREEKDEAVQARESGEEKSVGEIAIQKNFENTGEETERDTACEEKEYWLQAENRAESVKIKSFPCYISPKGELLENEDETVLGKIHARFSRQRNAVYIEDMKSESGTFVNGRRIAGNEIHKLNEGDSIMLADRSYRYVRVC